MSCINDLPSPVLQSELPRHGFPNPFSNVPHPLAQRAALALQHQLTCSNPWRHDFDAPGGGKMFGVLVVRGANGEIGYLAAFSGMLGGEWEWPAFVPPLFNQQHLDSFMPQGETRLAAYEAQIKALQSDPELARLREQLALLQQQCDSELLTLVARHKQRKAARRALRDQLSPGEEREARLVKLSFESQQDRRELRACRDEWRARLAALQERVALIEQQVAELKQQRSRLSNRLHRQLFNAYRLTNRLGEEKTVARFFERRLPPGGSGDCAAPKLLQYAHQQGLMPLAMAEFWWGASPTGRVRHHGHYYPACRGKCHPILPFMLKGLNLQPRVISAQPFHDSAAPEVLYEDDELLVINKPAGLLSVPGKETRDSVQRRLQQRYPDHDGLLLVHRLDMSTSGLLLVAKHRIIHKALQQQFIKRTVEKRYVALLSKRLPEFTDEGAELNSGTIELPLRVDVDDRPRQMVCFLHGKPAVTHWEVIARHEESTRVYFYPHTGRTHQLRLHAAHQAGLNAPIYGDELYGKSVERLLLHAERLCFDHPVTNKRIEVISPVPF